MWIGNHLKAQNGLQRVCTIPAVQSGVVYTPGFLRGQTEFQSAWVCVAGCLVLSQAPGLIPCSYDVRIDPA